MENTTGYKGGLVWRIVYGLIVLIAIMAFFMPWYTLNGQVVWGLGALLAFSLPYLIGLIKAIIIFFTGSETTKRPQGVGSLMVTGVIITIALIETEIFLGGLTQTASGLKSGGGLWLALVISFVYRIVGSKVAVKFGKNITWAVKTK